MNIINQTIERFEGYNEEISSKYDVANMALHYLEQFQTAHTLYMADPANEDLYENLTVIYNAAVQNLSEAYDELEDPYISNILNQIEDIYVNTPEPEEPVETPIPPLEPPEEPSEPTDWWQALQDWFSGAYEWVNTQDTYVQWGIWILIIIIIMLIIRRLFFPSK